jgi:guanylate kinase
VTLARNDPRRGRLIVLAGPSGVGKSSVVRGLHEALPALYFSVSATTRAPRAGEVDGRDYRFVGPAGFDDLIARGELLEWAEIHGGLQRSGTPRAPVEEALDAGRPVLVEVDLHGARAIKSVMPESVTVFLAPPTLDELVRRLRARGTETDAQFTRRLETAQEEMAARHEFDVVVVNDDLRTVVAQLVELLVGPGFGSAASGTAVPAGAPPITGVPE